MEYRDLNCSYSEDYFPKSDCSGHGSCVIGSGRCDCEEGWYYEPLYLIDIGDRDCPLKSEEVRLWRVLEVCSWAVANINLVRVFLLVVRKDAKIQRARIQRTWAKFAAAVWENMAVRRDFFMFINGFVCSFITAIVKLMGSTKNAYCDFTQSFYFPALMFSLTYALIAFLEPHLNGIHSKEDSDKIKSTMRMVRVIHFKPFLDLFASFVILAAFLTKKKADQTRVMLFYANNIWRAVSLFLGIFQSSLVCYIITQISLKKAVKGSNCDPKLINLRQRAMLISWVTIPSSCCMAGYVFWKWHIVKGARLIAGNVFPSISCALGVIMVYEVVYLQSWRKKKPEVGAMRSTTMGSTLASNKNAIQFKKRTKTGEKSSKSEEDSTFSTTNTFRLSLQIIADRKSTDNPVTAGKGNML